MRHAKRPVQSATVNRYIATISAVLNYAQERGWIASVPRVTKLEEEKKRVHFLDST